jgi:hypothetical protein
MRLAQSPPGQPFEAPRGEPDFDSAAAFGPGRRYWTMSGRVLISDGDLLLVMPEEDARPARVVVSAPVGAVTVRSKPWWSFGAGLLLNVEGDDFTVEPASFYPGASVGKVRGARESVRDFEAALAAAKGSAEA